MTIEIGDTVMVEKGKHKGVIGVVDDEEGSSLIVYPLGNSLSDTYIVVRESSLRKLENVEPIR